MRAEAGVRPVRQRRPNRTRRAIPATVPRPLAILLWVLAAVAGAALVAGIAFAGSPGRLAAGVEIAGVDVGGMKTDEARTVLARKAARYSSIPVVFTAGGERWSLMPNELDARVDWAAAVEEGRAAGEWPFPVRGLKRLAVRLFGADVEPSAAVFEPRLERELDRIAAAIDEPGRHASIVLRSLAPAIVPERVGRALDRRAAEATVTTALAGFDRRPVRLPVRADPPAVTADDLRPVAAQVRTALSAPVTLGWKDADWPVPPEQLADLLLLPANGARELRIGGPEAERYFGNLSRAVDRKAADASFAITAEAGVRIVPGKNGRALDVKATERALLAAALSRDDRRAELVVRVVEPDLTTKRARAMGVTRILASYTTPYSGTADRIRNLQLAAAALDGTLVGPGKTFSFNATVGPRTEERGFRSAPVILNGEYEEGIGGGVSQVATTVFNAAWEAGLKITTRRPHALYISRYPLGRDATVNYPDVDLRFLNDTERWVVIRATSGATGITIALLGGGTERRVVSEAGQLEEVGPPLVERIPDSTLFVGETVVEEEGEPARAVTVTRVVYEGEKVLYEETWRTTYRSERKVVRVGTKPRPGMQAPKAPGAPKEEKPQKSADEPKASTPPPPTPPTGG